MSDLVMAISTAKNNAELMVECRQLGYLDDDWWTLDPTYGQGRFWNLWRPPLLVASDLYPSKDWVLRADFTRLPLTDRSFDAVVLDPPYKLNGTGGSHPSDEGYEVAGPSVSQRLRHQLIRDGITECVRVLRPNGVLLVKCQDQVNGGKVKWQTREFADHAESIGCRLVDMLHLPSYRPQPTGRRQEHARRNYSTLLVFEHHKPTCRPPAGGDRCAPPLPVPHGSSGGATTTSTTTGDTR